MYICSSWYLLFFLDDYLLSWSGLSPDDGLEIGPKHVDVDEIY